MNIKNLLGLVLIIFMSSCVSFPSGYFAESNPDKPTQLTGTSEVSCINETNKDQTLSIANDSTTFTKLVPANSKVVFDFQAGKYDIKIGSEILYGMPFLRGEANINYVEIE